MTISTRRRTSARQWQLIGITLVVAYVVVQFIVFQISLARLPANWTIGGQAFPQQSVDEAVTQLQPGLQQPLTLHYLTSTLTLNPADIDFTFDITQTRRLAIEARTRSASLTDFLRHLILQPPAPRDVPVVISYSTEKARAFLADVATQYDRPPTPPAPQPEALSFLPGQGGYLLNVADSIPYLEDGLKFAVDRNVDLIVEQHAAPAPVLAQLQQVLQARLAAFPGVAGVFLKDLRSGQELGINSHLPFTGGGVLKLPIVLEIYRRSDLPLDPTTADRLTATLTSELSNLPANQLLNQIGEGNTFLGADTVTAALARVGLRDSYLALPFDQPITATTGLKTAANTNPPLNTNPSPAHQTTAADMGLLWEMIDQCQQGGGTLLVVYAKQLTPDKCRSLIELLRDQTPADMPGLRFSPMPDQLVLAQRPGGNFDTRGSAALIHSPGSDYVLTVFLNTANQSIDETAADAVLADLAKAAHNYFALTSAQP